MVPRSWGILRRCCLCCGACRRGVSHCSCKIEWQKVLPVWCLFSHPRVEMPCLEKLVFTHSSGRVPVWGANALDRVEWTAGMLVCSRSAFWLQRDRSTVSKRQDLNIHVHMEKNQVMKVTAAFRYEKRVTSRNWNSSSIHVWTRRTEQVIVVGYHAEPWERSMYRPIGGGSHQECCLKAFQREKMDQCKARAVRVERMEKEWSGTGSDSVVVGSRNDFVSFSTLGRARW